MWKIILHENNFKIKAAVWAHNIRKRWRVNSQPCRMKSTEIYFDVKSDDNPIVEWHVMYIYCKPAFRRSNIRCKIRIFDLKTKSNSSNITWKRKCKLVESGKMALCLFFSLSHNVDTLNYRVITIYTDHKCYTTVYSSYTDLQGTCHCSWQTANHSMMNIITLYAMQEWIITTFTHSWFSVCQWY